MSFIRTRDNAITDRLSRVHIQYSNEESTKNHGNQTEC